MGFLRTKLTDFQVRVFAWIRMYTRAETGLLAQELEQDLLGIRHDDPDFQQIYGSDNDIREALLVLESRGLIGFDVDMGWRANR